MGKQCRAKDPDSCRVHGSNDKFRNLKEIADNALAAGNVEAYMVVKAEMEKKEVPTVPIASRLVVSDEAVEEAAKAEWTMNTGSDWSRLGDVWKDQYRKQARGSLQVAAAYMPNGVVTNEAVEAAAKAGYEYREGKNSWNLQSSFQKEGHKREAKAGLEAASPHMGIPKQNESVARHVLGKTYDRFGFNSNSAFVSDIVKILNNPVYKKVTYEGTPSDAAVAVRDRLWGQYSDGGASATATADLFHKLGREKELGWIVEQSPGYRYDATKFE